MAYTKKLHRRDMDKSVRNTQSSAPGPGSICTGYSKPKLMSKDSFEQILWSTLQQDGPYSIELYTFYAFLSSTNLNALLQRL